MSSPLSQQVVQAKWGGFHLKDLFEIKSSIKRFDANKVTVLERGLHPYIIRSGSNNGQRGYLKENEQFLNEGNTISFGQDTATLFYQNKPYFTGDKIKILKSTLQLFLIFLGEAQDLMSKQLAIKFLIFQYKKTIKLI